MKYRFLILPLFLCFQLTANAGPILPGSEPSIREVTLSQIYRYAREMYRYGNYPQAIKSFQTMLDMECENSLAQHHLMKLAKKKEFEYLSEYLNNLPCEKKNFDEDDFLPASLYYETDNELMQEQLSYYNKRYRIAKAGIREAADNYSRLTKELEDEIITLRTQMAGQTNQPATPEELASVGKKLDQNGKYAAQMDAEISRLREQLDNERAKSQAEIADLKRKIEHLVSTPANAEERAKWLDEQTIIIMETKDESIAQLKERLADEVTDNTFREKAPVTQTTRPRSQVNNEEINRAKALLQEKQLELEARDRELMSLQEKFDELQKRLRMIQEHVENQNMRIQSLQKSAPAQK